MSFSCRITLKNSIKQGVDPKHEMRGKTHVISLWLRLLIYLLVTVCIGTIYLDVGTHQIHINPARGPCAAFVFGFITVMSIGGFSSFVEEMKVLQWERLNGHYGVAAFVISNTISATPFLILICFLSGTICYYMVRLHPGFSHYIFFVLNLYAGVTVVKSLVMAIASVIPNFLMGTKIGAGIQAGNELSEIWKKFHAVVDKNLFNDTRADEDLPATRIIV
ncbi:hypothetical protein ACP70R_010622 [Stipagrostis hirtigluma subsp. patula]